jgi:predicted MPP superfamily phosphohydrolase
MVVGELDGVQRAGGRRAFHRDARWLRSAGVVALLLVGLAVGVLARAVWEVRNTWLVETTFSTDEVAAELRVVQVTDFHNLPRPAQVDQVVELVRGAEPDLIALTGDLVNTSNDALDPVERLVSGLATIDAPRFYVDGNHDHWSRDQDRLHELLERNGVTILVNESLPFEGAFGRIQLVGVDDYFSGHGDLAAAVAGLPDDGFRLVLTHSPGILPELDRHDVDYAMCGHTHGGQIRLPLIGALYQPGGDWFPKVSKGVYVDGAATLFVDSGVGVTGPPLRFLNQSQVALHRIGPAR